MKKKVVLLGFIITFLILGCFITSLGLFIEDQTNSPQEGVVATQMADPDTIYLRQNATINLSITNHHNTSIEKITFHQNIPGGLGFVDALGGANFTTKTIDYTWRDPQTNETVTLGINETLDFWYIVNGSNEGTFTLKGTVRYRYVGENETRSAETNLLEVHIRRLVPGNLQTLQVITSGSTTIELGENVTIELILRNFHENQTLYNVSFVQKFPKEGLDLINASGGVMEKTVNENVTERFINYTWSTPFGINETVRFQYIVNGSMNGTYTISGGTIKYDILVENETRTIDINSLTIEVGLAPSILPRPPKGTRDLGQVLLAAVIIVPTTFFALAAFVTRTTRPRRPTTKKKRNRR